MATAKEEVEELLGKLPNDCSLEDIQYHLYVLEKVRNGLEAVGATLVAPFPMLLALGACALVSAGDRRAAAAPALMLVLSLGAVSWGVYATLAAAEAGLGGSPAEALLARALTPGALAAVVALGLLALFLAGADALRERVGETARARWPAVWTAVMVGAALAATAPEVDPWAPLAAGLGLAGSALAAPRLAGADGARVGLWPAAAVGGLIGTAVFVGLSALGPRMPGLLAPLREAPVLAAAPAAWLIVKFLRREPAAAR